MNLFIASTNLTTERVWFQGTINESHTFFFEALGQQSFTSPSLRRFDSYWIPQLLQRHQTCAISQLDSYHLGFSNGPVSLLAFHTQYLAYDGRTNTMSSTVLSTCQRASLGGSRAHSHHLVMELLSLAVEIYNLFQKHLFSIFVFSVVPWCWH